MGCDIHSRAEERVYGGRWDLLDSALWKDPYYSEGSVGLYNASYTIEPFRGRNYELFALLADVRNDSGISPFAQPRGVPLDASGEWKAYVARWGSDLHSTSWITLRELIGLTASAQNMPIKHSGVLTRQAYIRLTADQIKPQSWARWITGSGVTVGEPDSEGNIDDDVTHVYASWEDVISAYTIQSLKDAAAPFSSIISRNPQVMDDYRFVFGFDN